MGHQARLCKVMIPQLSAAFGTTAVGVSAILGTTYAGGNIPTSKRVVGTISS